MAGVEYHIGQCFIGVVGEVSHAYGVHIGRAGFSVVSIIVSDLLLAVRGGEQGKKCLSHIRVLLFCCNVRVIIRIHITATCNLIRRAYESLAAALRVAAGHGDDDRDAEDSLPADLHGHILGIGQVVHTLVEAHLIVAVCPAVKAEGVLGDLLSPADAVRGDRVARYGQKLRGAAIIIIRVAVEGQDRGGGVVIDHHTYSVVGVGGQQVPQGGVGRRDHLIYIRLHLGRHVQHQDGVRGDGGLVHNGGRRAQAGQGHQKVSVSRFLHRVVRQPRYRGAGQCDILGGHGLIRPDASDVLGGQVCVFAHAEQVLPVGVGGRVRDRSRVRVRRQGRAGQKTEQHTDRQQPAQRLSQFSHVAFLLFSSRTECSQPAQGGRCVQAPLTS